MTTVNKEEIQKFSLMADEWWDVNGKFKPLHQFNPIRIDYILEKTLDHYKIKSGSDKPLKNLSLLDVGCGGGLISEPMCRLGANVTGIDASSKNIKIAELHSKTNQLDIKYLNKSPEQIKEVEIFDIILNLEVVEHVKDLDLYIKSCSRLLKKNGIIFTATLNRTFTSYFKAIIGAEYVLRWLPIGTHDWNSFLKPEELEKKLNNSDLSTLDVTGLSFNPFVKKWRRSSNLDVNYIILSKKV
jgi:2-polyprenyl-6-hydroxyphenyl methylase/3-demethylubiquinone-9 3-methyltransferase